ncbi:L,D-transpeptidase family protein [Phyllobacterium sp. 628]|uniref:L,D-transpeptidase family protein n=1 Tax=Phyllobacterium sp. 628 TaxID=2718938 RepID=UPI0016623958|nr:L,D-transpeptidase family protein [Phyllobacterium sp. 628]QND52218.1 L,D-transpeptidase family protein [Phyllobacterium sp. 628]
MITRNAIRSACLVILSPFVATLAQAADGKIDLVRVEKAERRMQLLSGDAVVREYTIALGARPEGHKRWEGDERTPEGRYTLDWRNPKSMAYKSIHISYPNTRDVASAKSMGVPPGGMIMIHGAANGYGWWGWLLQLIDWTDGCIAVTNREMDEIWTLVQDGTPIEINP